MGRMALMYCPAIANFVFPAPAGAAGACRTQTNQQAVPASKQTLPPHRQCVPHPSHLRVTQLHTIEVHHTQGIGCAETQEAKDLEHLHCRHQGAPAGQPANTSTKRRQPAVTRHNTCQIKEQVLLDDRCTPLDSTRHASDGPAALWRSALACRQLRFKAPLSPPTHTCPA